MRAAAWLLAAALTAGCSDDAATPAVPLVDAQITDALDASDVTPDAPPTEWTGELTLPFRYTGLSEPASGYERADITDNVGTVTASGDARPTLAAQTVDWSSAGYQLIHLYTTDANDLQIAFLYCRGGQTAGVYVEGLTTALSYIPDATPHPCELSAETHSVTARLRPFVGLPDGFEPVRMATLDGPGLTLDAQGVGRISLGGIDWSLAPFAWVDCPDAMCGLGGWYEIHSLLRGPDGATATVILYLMRDNPTQVRTAYGLRLDAPAHLPNTMYSAPWTLR